MNRRRPNKIRFLSAVPNLRGPQVTQWSMIVNPRTRLIQIRHKPPVNRDHVWSLRVACNLAQFLYFCQRGAERLFNDAWQAAFEKLDSHPDDLFHRHHGNTRVELLHAQHLIEILIRSNKTE